jgi:hypothetical protein
MSFVIIERNKKNVPSDNDIRAAMIACGGTVIRIESEGGQ